MGSSKPPRRRPPARRRAASPAQNNDTPEHLPFGHHRDDTDEPTDSLQDVFEHFFAGLGDFLGHLGKPDDDDRD